MYDLAGVLHLPGGGGVRALDQAGGVVLVPGLPDVVELDVVGDDVQCGAISARAGSS